MVDGRVVEYFGVVRVRGDGRCMFRAMAVGLAHITNKMLTSSSEEHEADQLRLAVAESMCRTAEKRRKFQDAETAISFEMPMATYCKRILQPTFWGGEPELLVLCHLLRRPIVVYLPAAKVRSAGTRRGGRVPRTGRVRGGRGGHPGELTGEHAREDW